MFALGVGDQVVAVTHECDYPQAATRLPQITSSALPPVSTSAEIDRHVRRGLHNGSSLYHLDADLLESLNPDLIITQELCRVCAVSYEIVARAAKRLGGDPRIVSLEPSSLEDVYANIRTVAELVHAEPAASRLIESLRTREEALRTQTRRNHPRTLVLEWTDPPMSGGHWTPGLIEIAGGTPVLCNPGANSVAITWSAIEEEVPDVVCIAPCGFNLETTIAAIDELRPLRAFTESRAYQEGRVFAVDGNAYVNRPGPRLIDTAEIFALCIDDAPTDDRERRWSRIQPA